MEETAETSLAVYLDYSFAFQITLHFNWPHTKKFPISFSSLNYCLFYNYLPSYVIVIYTYHPLQPHEIYIRCVYLFCIMLTAINITINRFICLMDVDCVIYKVGSEYLYRVFHEWRHNLKCVPKLLYSKTIKQTCAQFLKVKDLWSPGT